MSAVYVKKGIYGIRVNKKTKISNILLEDLFVDSRYAGFALWINMSTYLFIRHVSEDTSSDLYTPTTNIDMWSRRTRCANGNSSTHILSSISYVYPARPARRGGTKGWSTVVLVVLHLHITCKQGSALYGK